MKDALIANPALAGALAAVVGAAWLLLFAYRHDPREPPLAPYSSIWTRIPFIGHVFGMSSRKYEYFGDLARASDQPIFTVQLPGKKMYVVTKTEMIQQAQRNFRVLSFETLAIDMTVKMAGVSKQAHDLTHHGVHTDGYYAAIHENMVRLLQPANVRDTSSVALTNIERLWDTLGPAGQEAKNRIGLRKWLDYNITVASARAVYGDHGPYEEPGVDKAFWEWTDAIVPILLSPVPRLFAPSAIAAREKVVKAYAAYYAAGHVHEEGSPLAKMRHDAGIKYGVPTDDMARYEAAFGMALLLNTPVATFWMLFHLYSDAALLAQVRAEVDACIGPAAADGTKTISVDVLKASCPLLCSAWQEMLRFRAVSISPRDVVEDTQIGGYLLKKGSLLQMPSRLIHQDKKLWGEAALEYDPRRFMPGLKANKESSFRAFGGGKTLCPGRHFGFDEVLGAAALTVSRYDLTPVGGGKWEEPECWNTNVASGLMMVDEDVQLDVSIRKGQENREWRLVI